MKKIKTLTLLLLIPVLLLSLAACGQATSLVGRYVLSNVYDDPEGTTFAELEEIYAADNLKITDYMYFEFQSDARFTLVLFGDEEANGTYVLDGKTLTLKSAGEQFAAPISGDLITYTYQTGAKLVFKKECVGGLPVGAIIAIIAGSAVVLAGVAFLIVRSARKGENAT